MSAPGFIVDTLEELIAAVGVETIVQIGRAHV